MVGGSDRFVKGAARACRRTWVHDLIGQWFDVLLVASRPDPKFPLGKRLKREQDVSVKDPNFVRRWWVTPAGHASAAVGRLATVKKQAFTQVIAASQCREVCHLWSRG